MGHPLMHQPDILHHCGGCEPSEFLVSNAKSRPVPRRLTAYKLAVRGSRMPGAADGFSLGPDSIYFRKRLRQAHPETEHAMGEQRRACVEARLCFTRPVLKTTAESESEHEVARMTDFMFKFQTERPDIRPARCLQALAHCYICRSLTHRTASVCSGQTAQACRLCNPAAHEVMQAGHAALASGDFNAALYFFKLVRTWAPASLQAEVDLCEAEAAVPALPVRSCRYQLCCVRAWTNRLVNMPGDLAMYTWAQVMGGRSRGSVAAIDLLSLRSPRVMRGARRYIRQTSVLTGHHECSC